MSATTVVDWSTFLTSSEEAIVKIKGGYDKLKNELGSISSDGARVSYFVACLDELNLKLPTFKDEKSLEMSLATRQEGNRCFASNALSSALRLYTKSVAHAPLMSEALALAYANRSAVLQKMGHVKECLGDIQRAFNCGYPRNLRYKLLLRKGICLKLLGKNDQARKNFIEAKQGLDESKIDCMAKDRIRTEISEKLNTTGIIATEKTDLDLDLSSIKLHPPFLTVPELAFNPHAELVGASDCVDLMYSESAGRHLVANRDIQPGDVVLVEQPYVAHTYPQFIYNMCSHCGLRAFALIPCNSCTMVMFCSDECLEAAKATHSLECSVLPLLFHMEIDSLSLNTMKAFIKAGFDNIAVFMETRAKQEVTDKRTAGFSNGRYDPSDFNAVYHSQVKTRPHFFEEDLTSYITSALFVIHLRNILPDPLKFCTIIHHLFWCFRNNGAELREVYNGPPSYKDKDTPSGSGFYPLYNLINHDCDPTLGRDFYGYAVVLRAIMPIKKGNGLTIAYHHRFSYFPKVQRQLLLQVKGGFVCKCKACEENWPLFRDLPYHPVVPQSKKRALMSAAEKLIPFHEQVSKGEVITPIMAFRFIKHLNFLSQMKGGRLCQDFGLCQQALEQYWARQSNYYVDKYL